MGLPVEFRADQAKYEQGMAGLRATAKAAAEAGCTRCATWLRPCSDELPYLDNFRLHVDRLRPAAAILGEYGIRLGLEYVGPQTSRDGKRYEFIHNLPQLLELCGAIGTGNVGLLLDSWHWYTAHETAEDLKRLDNRLVVQVHVNDAPAGVPVDQQKDNVRDLPGATGVIDMTAFLQCLAAMGYDGPVTPEPFRPDLRQMPPAAAANLVGDAMGRIWQAAGLAER
jgi:sugar phosphate isomerase/epimerase